ncbi:MAG: alanine--tRNA ligase [Rickettsiales bacterium]|nr:alanine--tRNA ligase [Rickettsiales bacterium]|tara:strand:+ start:1117 stop:3741 length:2625 start_codon:yes stop_codon:yes gene_type:complete
MIKPKYISENIRESFRDFFKNQNHIEVPSSSLIPKDDPTLLFTNSGMVQFKNYFTGQENPVDKNIISIQKCLRAGGKHNDLENVGKTPRHHTFFEMLGNFSFGKYFKKEAIEMAWNFLTKELSIDKKRLIITHHKEDTDSQKIWEKVSGFSSDKIISIESDDNFWSMGDTGPCGPCSEIFFDNGDKLKGGLPGTKYQDGNRYVEIWNLVFMEYEKKKSGLEKLHKKCVDTGMGLERITALVSKKNNNYETDLFDFVFSDVEKIIGTKMTKQNEISFRVISDHIKSICMLMSDGIIPSNEGRGYVLRRIIRRAIVQSNKIKKEEIFLHKLVNGVVNKYSQNYFELKKSEKFIEENLKNEEIKFSDTLQTGLSILNDEINKKKPKQLSAELAFKLYDTYGFPIDVTQNILTEKNIKLDINQYFEIVKKNKEKQKNSWTGSGEKSSNKFFLELKNVVKQTKFVGYNQTEIEAELECIIKDEKFTDEILADKDNIFLVFNKTPFYAESGGQIGDSGKIVDLNGEFICNILDTKKVEGGIYLHQIEKNEKTKIIKGKKYVLSINNKRRKKIRNNHSATHLLHEALRNILGEHVSQKGSLVNDQKLRFDFTYNKSLTNKQISEIEILVNKTIRSNLIRTEELVTVREALESGAIALFGEKYPEKVRVITFNSDDDNSLVSKELCGGTHVNATGQIGAFKILSDSSVSSGVRRIEAITGEEVENHLNVKILLIEDIKKLLKASDNNIKEKIKNIQIDYNKLKKVSANKIIFSEKEIIGSNPQIYFDNTVNEPGDLKNFSDQIKQNFLNGIIILVSKKNNKISLVVSITNSLQEKYDAVELLKKLVEFLGGKGGGGRSDLAQGGAPFSKKFDELKSFILSIF